MKALVDTGNNLKDPLNNQPVIIVEQDALKGLLPPEIERVVAEVENGELSALQRLETLEAWQTRIRLIPFNSIGRKNGLLVGFRPDAVKSAIIPPALILSPQLPSIPPADSIPPIMSIKP